MRSNRLEILAAAAVIAIGLGVPRASFAVSGNDAPVTPPKASTSDPASGATAKPVKRKAPKTVKKPQQQSELNDQKDFLAGYKMAYKLIYTDHDYDAGIAKLRSLKHDENADVANLIGYSSRKLGRYDDSKYWYEKALAANPQHARTWSYYGMWQAEQGNMLKALDYLETVRGICGTGCQEYTELKGVIDGTRTY
ncbi:MAG: tetratricopeptide repeat protein [Xanthobacteraceae bacterium]